MMDIHGYQETTSSSSKEHPGTIFSWLGSPYPPFSHSPAGLPARVPFHPHLPAADGVERDAGVDLHGANVRPEQVSGAGLVNDAAAAGAAGARRFWPERVDGLDGAQLALVGLPLVAVESLIMIGEAAAAAASAASVVGALAGGVEVAATDAASAVSAPLATSSPPSSAASAGPLALHGHAAETTSKMLRRRARWRTRLVFGGEQIDHCPWQRHHQRFVSPVRFFLPQITNRISTSMFRPFWASHGHLPCSDRAFPLWFVSRSMR